MTNDWNNFSASDWYGFTADDWYGFQNQAGTAWLIEAMISFAATFHGSVFNPVDRSLSFVPTGNSALFNPVEKAIAQKEE